MNFDNSAFSPKIKKMRQKSFPNRYRYNTQRGNAVLIILIAIALFAALSWAFTRDTSSNIGWVKTEANKAAQTASADCQRTIASAMKRLQFRPGCNGIISSEEDGSNTNPGAPDDGSCSIYHPNGGGVTSCSSPTIAGPDPCDQSPAVGTACANGTIYAGRTPDGDVPMYTTPADAPGTYAYNDGNTFGYVNTPIQNCTTVTPSSAASCRTGKNNTAILIVTDANSGLGDVQSHQAAQYCADLSAYGKSDWYLPASDELNILYQNREEGALNGSFDVTGATPYGLYISSSETSATNAMRHNFGTNNRFANSKSNPMSVRCVRTN